MGSFYFEAATKLVAYSLRTLATRAYFPTATEFVQVLDTQSGGLTNISVDWGVDFDSSFTASLIILVSNTIDLCCERMSNIQADLRLDSCSFSGVSSKYGLPSSDLADASLTLYATRSDPITTGEIFGDILRILLHSKLLPPQEELILVTAIARLDPSIGLEGIYNRDLKKGEPWDTLAVLVRFAPALCRHAIIYPSDIAFLISHRKPFTLRRYLAS